MAKELFSMAAQEKTGSALEIKRRKSVIAFAWIFAIVFIGQSIFHLKDFPFHIPFQQAILIYENQVVLMKAVIDSSMGLAALGLLVYLLRPAIWSLVLFLILAAFMASSIVYSDVAGFEVIRTKGLSAAYALCFFLPIAVMGLMIARIRKRDQQEE